MRSLQRRRLLLVALSAGGVAFTAVLLLRGVQAGIFPWPGGDAFIWDRVGDELRAGVTPYGLRSPVTDTFWYGPPWAVLFAAVSWLPVEVQSAGLLAIKIASLRVIGGSWLGAGIVCWFPLVVFDLAGGNFNLLIAAGIVLAVQGRPGTAVVAAFAQALTGRCDPPARLAHRIRRHDCLCGRHSAMAMAVAGVVRPACACLRDPLGPMIPVPLGIRAVAAVALLIAWRPWSRALAAVLLIPAFYWGSLVLLVAPISVAIQSIARDAGQTVASPTELTQHEAHGLQGPDGASAALATPVVLMAPAVVIVLAAHAESSGGGHGAGSAREHQAASSAGEGGGDGANRPGSSLRRHQAKDDATDPERSSGISPTSIAIVRR